MSKSDLEERFAAAWQAAGWSGREPVREHRFDSVRRWRFDFAWPELMVAVEIEGGGGRHHTFAGSHADMDKYNAATLAGWRVLRFDAKHLPAKLKRETAAEWVERVAPDVIAPVMLLLSERAKPDYPPKSCDVADALVGMLTSAELRIEP